MFYTLCNIFDNFNFGVNKVCGHLFCRVTFYFQDADQHGYPFRISQLRNTDLNISSYIMEDAEKIIFNLISSIHGFIQLYFYE